MDLLSFDSLNEHFLGDRDLVVLFDSNFEKGTVVIFFTINFTTKYY